MINEAIVKQLVEIVGEEDKILVNEPMKNHTSFKVGGNVDYLVFPTEVNQVKSIIIFCKDNNIKYYVMGNGSNLLVTDKGFRGIIIKLSEIKKVEFQNTTTIKAYCGILLSQLANIALKKELSGLEFASGIPGTLGGAVAMNAGAYGGEMKDVIVEAQLLNEDGTIITLTNDELELGYRSSIIQKEGYIVLSTLLKLNKGSKQDIKTLMDDLNNRRRTKQPLTFPSAGSTFKRPQGYYAGKLIQDAGLKGYTIGGAQVSEKHCGFVINNGSATAQDIINLIQYIQKNIKDKFGVEMNTEVKIIGE